MTRLLYKVVITTAFLFALNCSNAQIKNIIHHAKDKTTDKVNDGVDKAVDNSGNSTNNTNQANNTNTSTNSDQQQTSSDQTQTSQPATVCKVLPELRFCSRRYGIVCR